MIVQKLTQHRLITIPDKELGTRIVRVKEDVDSVNFGSIKNPTDVIYIEYIRRVINNENQN